MQMQSGKWGRWILSQPPWGQGGVFIRGPGNHSHTHIHTQLQTIWNCRQRVQRQTWREHARSQAWGSNPQPWCSEVNRDNHCRSVRARLESATVKHKKRHNVHHRSASQCLSVHSTSHLYTLNIQNVLIFFPKGIKTPLIYISS